MAEIMYEKLIKCPNFTRHLSGKCLNFTLCLPQKYFPGIFFFGGGIAGEGNPLAPNSYAYGWAPGPPPAKSGHSLIWQKNYRNWNRGGVRGARFHLLFEWRPSTAGALTAFRAYLYSQPPTSLFHINCYAILAVPSLLVSADPRRIRS